MPDRPAFNVHLVDGTYELFRHFFALPSHVTKEGREVAATRGVVGSVLGMLEGGATHVGVATDHVIESFRNDLWPGYKTSAGVDPLLLAQFPLLEEGLEALGVTVWAMVEREADDALASAALVTADDPTVERVLICTPDKDLGQCVRGDRVVLFDRRKRLVIDEAGVTVKFGVPPMSIPDYLALVGDSADGFPGLPGWGARSAATVLARYGSLENIPTSVRDWDISVRGAGVLAHTLEDNLDRAVLFRELARLHPDPPVIESVEELRWRGPRDDFAEFARSVEMPELAERARKLAARRSA
jgi:5'-3' exonuclease